MNLVCAAGAAGDRRTMPGKYFEMVDEKTKELVYNFVFQGIIIMYN